MSPFNPSYGSNQKVDAGLVTARIEIGRDGRQVRVMNLGANLAYVRMGSATVDASIKDYPVPANTIALLSKADAHSWIAFISPDGGASLHIMIGQGS